jgi:hypothetical protein
LEYIEGSALTDIHLSCGKIICTIMFFECICEEEDVSYDNENWDTHPTNPDHVCPRMDPRYNDNYDDIP